ncbi:MAG TPA: hypothetical protein VGO09_09000, partial [Flavisolibacter sp.]|nr:hypothetical protein [Flavisolibacter sp.]
MESDQLELLQQEIEKTFGRRVLSSADCHLLCVDIEQRTQQRISFNTLRRHFNLMKDSHEPSIYTLDVLSNYCGFSSFDDFILFKKNHAVTNVKNMDTGLLNYLIMLFKNTEVNNSIDITYFSFVHHTINYLEKHQHMIDAFQRGISKTRNGQNYYFEQFINIDKLNSYYGDGLRYYLNERKDKNAQVFGYSLLCLR